MADIRPIGAATSMAMNEISRVPANSGTAPNAPLEPTWPSRMAVCGLQSRPNRNSAAGTAWKKRAASNSTDSTMPMVVKMASIEHSSRKARMMRSTWMRALIRGVRKRRVRPALSANTARQAAVSARSAACDSSR